MNPKRCFQHGKGSRKKSYVFLFLVARPLRGGEGKGLATKIPFFEALKKNSGKFFVATKLEGGGGRP